MSVLYDGEGSTDRQPFSITFTLDAISRQLTQIRLKSSEVGAPLEIVAQRSYRLPNPIGARPIPASALRAISTWRQALAQARTAPVTLTTPEKVPEGTSFAEVQRAYAEACRAAKGVREKWKVTSESDGEHNVMTLDMWRDSGRFIVEGASRDETFAYISDGVFTSTRQGQLKILMPTHNPMPDDFLPYEMESDEMAVEVSKGYFALHGLDAFTLSTSTRVSGPTQVLWRLVFRDAGGMAINVEFEEGTWDLVLVSISSLEAGPQYALRLERESVQRGEPLSPERTRPTMYELKRAGLDPWW